MECAKSLFALKPMPIRHRRGNLELILEEVKTVEMVVQLPAHTIL
jgi:hypothetical protein